MNPSKSIHSPHSPALWVSPCCFRKLYENSAWYFAGLSFASVRNSVAWTLHNIHDGLVLRELWNYFDICGKSYHRQIQIKRHRTQAHFKCMWLDVIALGETVCPLSTLSFSEESSKTMIASRVQGQTKTSVSNHLSPRFKSSTVDPSTCLYNFSYPKSSTNEPCIPSYQFAILVLQFQLLTSTSLGTSSSSRNKQPELRA